MTTDVQIESLRTELQQARLQNTARLIHTDQPSAETRLAEAERKLAHMQGVMTMVAKLLHSQGHSRNGHPKPCTLCLAQWIMSDLGADPSAKEHA